MMENSKRGRFVRLEETGISRASCIVKYLRLETGIYLIDMNSIEGALADLGCFRWISLQCGEYNWICLRFITCLH